MNQDNQSEVIENNAAGGEVTIPRVLFDFLMGQGQIYGAGFGDDCPQGLPRKFWWRALLRACDRPSLSTPSEGVIEQRAAADYVDRQDCRVQDRHGDWDGYTGQQMVECFLAGVALARLSPLPLVEEGGPWRDIPTVRTPDGRGDEPTLSPAKDTGG
jgi:hypothetical protein